MILFVTKKYPKSAGRFLNSLSEHRRISTDYFGRSNSRNPQTPAQRNKLRLFYLSSPLSVNPQLVHFGYIITPNTCRATPLDTAKRCGTRGGVLLFESPRDEFSAPVTMSRCEWQSEASFGTFFGYFFVWTKKGHNNSSRCYRELKF